MHAFTTDGSDDAIVRATGIHKSYATGRVRVDALRGVDLTLRRGEMAAIMGPSGCGKTTLLNCLSGLDDITSGEVVIDGTPLASLSDRERTDYRARRMGFVFQFYNLMPVLTSVENVEEIVALMRRLNRERGLSFLIVTHDIAVGRKTDRIIRMLDGQVVEELQLEVPDAHASHVA